MQVLHMLDISVDPIAKTYFEQAMYLLMFYIGGEKLRDTAIAIRNPFPQPVQVDVSDLEVK